MRETEIDSTDLQKEFCVVAADLAYWSSMAAKAEAALQRSKDDLARAEANAADMARNFLASSDVRVTEARVSEMVARSASVRAAQEAHYKAIQDRNDTRGVAWAIKTKADMLQALGQMRRAELKAEPYVKYED